MTVAVGALSNSPHVLGRDSSSDEGTNVTFQYDHTLASSVTMSVPNSPEHFSNDTCTLSNVLVYDGTGYHLRRGRRWLMQNWSGDEHSKNILQFKVRELQISKQSVSRQRENALGCLTCTGVDRTQDHGCQSSVHCSISLCTRARMHTYRTVMIHTFRKLASMLQAIAFASSVLPVPGGPYKSTPAHCS